MLRFHTTRGIAIPGLLCALASAGCADDVGSPAGAASTGEPVTTGPDDTPSGSEGSTTGDGTSTSDAESGTQTGATNQPPVAVEDLYHTLQGGEPLEIDAAEGVLTNDEDPDGDELRATVGEQQTEAGGTVQMMPNGAFTYTPPPSLFGRDAFTYVVEDPDGGTSEAVVQIGLTPQVIDLADVHGGAHGFAIDGEGIYSEAGTRVVLLEDMNGDGRAEIGIASHRTDAASRADAGRLYVVWGKDDGDPVALADVADGAGGFVVNGASVGDRLGEALAPAGDVDGDGVADLIAGAPAAAAGQGEAVVVFGHSANTAVEVLDVRAGSSPRGFVIRGAAEGDAAGRSVAGLGDLNGDGLGDVLVTAPHSDAVYSDAGRAYVVFGKADPEPVDLAEVGGSVPGFVIDPEDAGHQLGDSAAAAGDVNGDGVPDVVLGAVHGGADGAGRGWVVFGKAGPEPVDLARIAGAWDGGFVLDSTSYRVGYAARGLGDVDGDGLADVGLSTQDPADQGRVFVVWGKADFWAVDLERIEAGTDDGGVAVRGAADGAAATSIAAAGDWDDDGKVDLVVGAPGAAAPGGDVTGRAYVVYGAHMDGPIDLADAGDGVGGFSMVGELANDRAGAAVDGAADVNGDGRLDLVVSAPPSQAPGAIFTGRIYVLFNEAPV